jgi:hypothetical protein
MKQLSSTSWLLSALVLLCGCGGGVRTSGPTSGSPPQGLNIAGNWHFSTTSTVSGTPPVTIAGSISQSGSSVSGAVHVDGSICFDRLTTIGLTGTLTGSNIALTSESVDGQVITVAGSITDRAFTGTYTINGGCASGDHRNVTGIRIPFIANQLSGTFTTSGQKTFSVVGDVAQSSGASLDGSFGISGTVTFSTPCFSSGTVTPGTFSSGSFIMGRAVALEIETSNGILTFLGTVNLDRSEVSGDYTISGGTCDDTGTAVLYVTSPWDY